MTRLIRGAQAAKTAQTLTAILAATPDDVPQLLRQLDLHSAGSIVTRLREGEPLEHTYSRRNGLVKSRAEAKRLLSARGLYINNAPAGWGGKSKWCPAAGGQGSCDPCGQIRPPHRAHRIAIQCRLLGHVHIAVLPPTRLEVDLIFKRVLALVVVVLGPRSESMAVIEYSSMAASMRVLSAR